MIELLKWTPKTGQQFKWDTVTRNGVNHDRYKKAQRSPAGVQSQGGAWGGARAQDHQRDCTGLLDVYSWANQSLSSLDLPLRNYGT